MTDTVGVNPDLLKAMINNINHNADQLQNLGNHFMGRFNQSGLDISSVRDARRISAWMKEQLPYLQGIHNHAKAIQDPGRSDTMVQYPERAAFDHKVPLIPPPRPSLTENETRKRSPSGGKDSRPSSAWLGWAAIPNSLVV
jgi:hypothetical protein